MLFDVVTKMLLVAIFMFRGIPKNFGCKELLPYLGGFVAVAACVVLVSSSFDKAQDIMPHVLFLAVYTLNMYKDVGNTHSVAKVGGTSLLVFAVCTVAYLAYDKVLSSAHDAEDEDH